MIFEGEKRFDLVVRLKAQNRTNISDIENLYINLPNSSQIPLRELAKISYEPGPMQISRDNTNRRTYVGINIRDRDVKSVVKDIQAKLDAEFELPPGYFIRYGGAFENLERASAKLANRSAYCLGVDLYIDLLCLAIIPTNGDDLPRHPHGNHWRNLCIVASGYAV